jgi:PAS domain S-box-containing protein
LKAARQSPVASSLNQSALNEVRMRAIIRSSREAIIPIDEDEQILMFNPMAEQLFGIPAAQAIRTSLDQLMPARFRSAQAMYARCSLIRSLCDRALVISPPIRSLWT